jgi:hypothetical protein
MATKRFKATLGSNEGNLFFEVPFDVKEVFGKARAPVKVSINGYQYRWTIAVYGGKYFVGIRRSHREAAGVELGQTVSVILELDEAPRIVEVPPELEAIFAKKAKLRAAWGKLSYTHQKEHAQAIREAKKPETRERRLEKLIAALTLR